VPLQRRFLDAWTALHPGAADTVTTLNTAYGHTPSRIDRIFVAREGVPRLDAVASEVLFRAPGPDSVWASDHFGLSARLAVRR
jgi:endonuclease/exonuclease/phosphatase family metal-dependent hydrolase